MTQLGYFRRVHKTPFPTRPDLHGPVVIVNQGDTILADMSVYKDIVGFEFVGTKLPPMMQDTSNIIEKRVESLGGVDIVSVQNTLPQYVEILTEDISEPNPIEDLQTKEEILKEVKALSNKQWFVISKEKIKFYFDKLEIDYSHLPDNRLEMQKYIKSKIKEM